jgi:serine/threonine-protein kinase
MADIDLLGRTLGPFEIISELGRGGMAVVYKARQADLQRMVALKILPPELSRDRTYLQRFLQEARSAAALEHPHIVPIYAIGEAQGYNYIAMKYITGKTLKDVVQAQGALNIQQTATMLEQVADALDYAHSQGVIHRDIKPSNMMAERSGWVYLTDFGLARGSENAQGLTLAGTVMGTPEYMSPEQAQGLATIGPQTDIYALGVVLYELLTGQVPFQADTPMGMLVARLQYAPRPPRDYRSDLPEAVEDVIMRALARKPEARFATARDMVAGLKSAAGLSTRSFAPQQRPISPPQGVPTERAQPISPPVGIAPPRPVSASQPAQPIGPVLELPPTQVAGQPQNTPPYVIPTNVGPTFSAARSATPPAQPAAFGLPSTGTTSAVEKKPGSRRGIFIGLGLIVMILVAAFLVNTFVLQRPDPRIAKGLFDARAALDRKDGINDAIAGYKQIIELDPKNADAHTMLALIYNLRDRNKDAEAEARAVIATDPKAAFAYSQLAESLNNQGEYQEALAAAHKAVELNDKLAFGYSARSGIKANLALENSDKDLLEEAAEDANKALDLSQKDDNLSRALAHSARGYVYWQEYSLTYDKSKVASGVEEFNQAIGLQSQIALFHSNLGYFYNEQGEYERAKEKFEDALGADDQYGHTHAGLGWNLYYLNDYSGAMAEFSKALEFNPNDVDAYVGQSYVYQDQGDADYDKAIEALNKAAGIAPKNPTIPSKTGWLYRNKGTEFEYGSDQQKRAYAESESQFRKALELNSNYTDALTGLGWVLQDQADVLKDEAKFHEAIETLQQSLALNDEQPYAHNGLGWSYIGLEQYDEAEQAFNRAIELQSDYANAYYGLGRALQNQGKNEDARKAYQQAVDYGSTNAQQALDELK